MRTELNTGSEDIAIVPGHERGIFTADPVDESLVFVRALLTNIDEKHRALIRSGDDRVLRHYIEPAVTGNGTFIVRPPALLRFRSMRADETGEVELGAGATFTEFAPTHPTIDWSLHSGH